MKASRMPELADVVNPPLRINEEPTQNSRSRLRADRRAKTKHPAHLGEMGRENDKRGIGYGLSWARISPSLWVSVCTFT
jgi:hypothetical protein